MPPLKRRLSQAASIGGAVVHDPSQGQYLLRWGGSLRKSTLDLRLPWLPYRVIEVLDAYVQRDHRVFEYGGGGSTLWMAQRCGELVTIEHDRDWFPMLEESVAHLPNVTLIHETDDNDYAGYVDAISAYSDSYFDLVVVDGRERVRCFANAMAKVKPGGWLVLDNSDRARYDETKNLAHSWPSVTYRGLTPSEPVATQTTIWRRPAD